VSSKAEELISKIVGSSKSEGAVFGGGPTPAKATQDKVDKLWSDFRNGINAAKKALNGLKPMLSDAADKASFKDMESAISDIEDMIS
jgi:hypothetical protein